MSKYIELAKKLKALVDQGVGGEKVNADKMLRTLMVKQNISMLDIEGEIVERHKFVLDPNFKIVFMQIASTVLGPNFDFYSNTTNRKTFYIECTAAESLEIKAKFNFYLPLYQESMDQHRTAFYIANKLFPKDIGKESEPPTPEELAHIEKARAMARNIEGKSFMKQLSTGE